MLVLDRKEGQAVATGSIVVGVRGIDADSAHLAVGCPTGARVYVGRVENLDHLRRQSIEGTGSADFVVTLMKGDVVVIGEDVYVWLLRIRRNRVLLGFEAPLDVPVLKPEKHLER